MTENADLESVLETMSSRLEVTHNRWVYVLVEILTRFVKLRRTSSLCSV